jgi:predicted nucleic acid-binding protein
MSSARTGSDRPTYVDTSAFVKLVVDEPESRALRSFLAREPRRLASSALLEIEAVRAARAAGDPVVITMSAMVESLDLVELIPAIRARARTLDPVGLRTLDAIHLATALEIDAREMLVYDRRLAAAAERYGIAPLDPPAV